MFFSLAEDPDPCLYFSEEGKALRRKQGFSEGDIFMALAAFEQQHGWERTRIEGLNYAGVLVSLDARLEGRIERVMVIHLWVQIKEVLGRVPQGTSYEFVSYCDHVLH
jgi:hypothetical protein